MRYSDCMDRLGDIIRDEIRATGPMRFDRFMELALYHPELGYYARPGERNQIGRSGDFFTSVSVGPLFGRLLARQFLQMWEILGKPDPFWIIEQGAHDGRLACDILSWCRSEASPFFAVIRYAFIESSHAAHAAQRKSVGKASVTSRIEWFEKMPLPEKPRTGVFLSNELVDAFPVRVMSCQSGQWREKYVTADESGAFTWTIHPLEDAEGLRAVEKLPLLEGYTTELNLHAPRWMSETATLLDQGYFLTIDYGFPASVYYAPFRTEGTLTAYQKHQRTREILEEPGQRDITAHVDFTALARAGEKAGLQTLGFIDQQRFLMGIARNEFSSTVGPRVGIRENQRAWNMLTHPEFLGSRFQVLLQAKNAPANLDGLQFARPGGLE